MLRYNTLTVSDRWHVCDIHDHSFVYVANPVADLRRKFFSGILPLNLKYEIVVKSMGSLINLAKYRVGAPPKILEAQNIDENWVFGTGSVKINLIYLFDLFSGGRCNVHLGNHFVESLLKWSHCPIMDIVITKSTQFTLENQIWKKLIARR